MNRTEEYEALLAQLNDLPPELDRTVERAETRYRKDRRGRRAAACLSSLAGVAAAFVLLVNFSLPFARACGKIPFLRELAQAVAFSPSLSAAVENEYVQPIDQTQSANGVTMTVRYLIADNQQLILFYELNSDDPGLSLECHPQLRPAEDGAALPEHGLTYGGAPADPGELRSLTALFTSAGGSVPEEFILEAHIRASAAGWQATAEASAQDLSPAEDPPETDVCTLSFPISVDLGQIRPERVYEVGQEVVLEGQTITVERLEIYPTSMQIVLSDHEENTAWLTGLNFFLEDQDGNQYGRSGGITALGSPDSPFWPIHKVDSAYFSGAKSYTLFITGATWLDKDLRSVTLDLKTGMTTPLPDMIQALTFEPKGDGYLFRAYLEPTDRGLFTHTCRDSQGNVYDIPIVSFTTASADQLETAPEGTDAAARLSMESFQIDHYHDTEITLDLTYTRQSEFDDPIVVKID